MRTLNSYSELTDHLKDNRNIYLLLYKSTGATQNNCAKNNLEAAEEKTGNKRVFISDVATVRDIHIHYPVNTVPVLLEFSEGKFAKSFKGCHPDTFYENILSGTSVNISLTGTDEKPQKNVVVYSTPTCSWCNTLKNYLKEKKIRFRDIDVSQDQKAAEEMVKRSGQQGVPQTTINGEVIVGFDKPRIDKLLGINSK